MNKTKTDPILQSKEEISTCVRMMKYVLYQTDLATTELYNISRNIKEFKNNFQFTEADETNLNNTVDLIEKAFEQATTAKNGLDTSINNLLKLRKKLTKPKR